MTISQARAHVRYFARSAGSSTQYKDAQVDRAIRTIGNDFVLHTNCNLRTDSVSFVNATSTFSLTALIAAGWRPEKSTRAWIPVTVDYPAKEIDLITHRALLDAQIVQGATGQPMQMAFSSYTTGEVYPTPDADYTGTLQWREPFTTWTIGAALAASATATLSGSGIGAIAVVNPGGRYATAPTVTISGDGSGATATSAIDFNGQVSAVTVTAAGTGYTAATVAFSGGGSADSTLNLPDDWLLEILTKGAPFILQGNETEHREAASNLYADYLKFRDGFTFGSLGAQEATRDMLPES